MSSSAAPFGFRASRHQSGYGTRGVGKYTIGSTYGTSIFTGDPVVLNTDGTLNIGTATNDILGIFAGCEYIDATGKPTTSAYWPAGITATNIVAYVYDDPAMEFVVQADGAIAATAVGAQADLVTGTGSTATGISAYGLNHTVEAGGAQGQFRILGLYEAQDNAWGDSYTMVRVGIAQHQYVANKVGI